MRGRPKEGDRPPIELKGKSIGDKQRQSPSACRTLRVTHRIVGHPTHFILARARMGIKGLSSYIKEHRRKLSYSLELSSKVSPLGDDAGSELRVIVDGWS